MTTTTAGQGDVRDEPVVGVDRHDDLAAARVAAWPAALSPGSSPVKVEVVARDQPDVGADQRQPDHRDDGAGDQRREEADDHRERLGDDQAEDAGDEHGAVDDGQAVAAAVLPGDDDHRVEHGEGRAGDDGQPDAEDLAMPAAWMTVAIPQTSRSALTRIAMSSGQAQRAADDERHGHRAGVHDEEVLQAEHQAPAGSTSSTGWTASCACADDVTAASGVGRAARHRPG